MDFQKATLKKITIGLLPLLLFLLLSQTTYAHVKWFADFSFADQPLALSAAITPTFLALTVFSMIVIGALVLVDLRLSNVGWYQQINRWLEQYQAHSLLILRIATGVTLLLSWQVDTVLMPDLRVDAAWVGWFQYILAFLLLFPRLVPLSGLGLFILYIIGVTQYGIFHLLDYVIILGVGYFLLVSNTSNTDIKGSAIPVLYFTTGFSLCWVALEKVIYPQWGLYILGENPQLALGFPLEFFLIGAAFVEFSLGYLLIIGLLERPLALLITLVFFTTTLIFGKVEVIGHTMIHAALIVFLLEGPGHVYRPPISFHKNIKLRTAFASINFALLLLLLLIPYAFVARQIHESYVATTLPTGEQALETVAGTANTPIFDLILHEDERSGWNLELITTHLQLGSPGTSDIAGEGYAQLYLDNQAMGRIYGGWYHLPQLNPGTYQVKVVLISNDHAVYTAAGDPISAEKTLVVRPRNPLELLGNN